MDNNSNSAASPSSEFLAHISEDGTREETVYQHLQEVAEMAAHFAEPFGAQDWAHAAGLAHDIGKYSKEFQRRIKENGAKCDHSTAGAFELLNLNSPLLPYCVAGHHGGLPDGGSLADVAGEGTLVGRLRKAPGGFLPNYKTFSQEVQLSAPDSSIVLDRKFIGFEHTFLTRMIFSCLVDADFLCTERFMNNAERPSFAEATLEQLAERLGKRVETFFPPQTPLNEIRCKLLKECEEAAQLPPGVFSLTAPTGVGKTYSSLRFAFEHALAPGHNMRRVIYAIPYTSIIEQNAKVFRDVLGEGTVLEHHSNFDFEDAGEWGERARLAVENWDAPLVVTTNVQLFESLFACKTSRCRKLHNLAGSVIVLDEAQMLPTDFLEPCVRALAELALRYNCTVVLCTATQPALSPLFEKLGCPVHEIVADPAGLQEQMRRVTYQDAGILSDDELTERLLQNQQVLCVVNSRKQARELYSKMSEQVDDVHEAGLFHLSTLMHADHRFEVLAEVRSRLQAGLPCRLVSTSLIEAGVDVDFPCVYRALAGVDSIVQAAGRCNREGKRPASESMVYIFDPKEEYKLPSAILKRRANAKNVLGEDAELCTTDIDLPKYVEPYFQRLHKPGHLDTQEIVSKLDRIKLKKIEGKPLPLVSFAEVAKDFQMITEGSYTVIIEDEETKDALEQLKQGFVSREIMRRLQRHAVTLYKNDINELEKTKSVQTLAHISDDHWRFVDASLYTAATGLDISRAGGQALMF